VLLGLLHEDSNGRRASRWQGISVVRRAPLIKAVPPLMSSLPFTTETIVDEEGNEQLSSK